MKKILVVRRDNIGDLICTLPLIAALRRLNPSAKLDILVNSYNRNVVNNNKDLDQIFSYTKDKHRDSQQSWISTHFQRIYLTFRLFLTRYDYVILASVGLSERSLRWARLIRPRHVVGFVENGRPIPKILNVPIFLKRELCCHEVEYLMQLSKPFGNAQVDTLPRLIPESVLLEKAKSIIHSEEKKILLGVNISARLPSQQWALNKWISFITEISKRYKCVLFWSPGSSTNKLHPGDDAKAKLILESTAGCDVVPFQTCSLSDLIAGFFLVDFVLTPDGGAMHIAAACGKPTVALFGESDARQWFPWGVTHVVLQTEGRHVDELSVDLVIEACESLAVNLKKD